MKRGNRENPGKSALFFEFCHTEPLVENLRPAAKGRVRARATGATAGATAREEGSRRRGWFARAPAGLRGFRGVSSYSRGGLVGVKVIKSP